MGVSVLLRLYIISSNEIFNIVYSLKRILEQNSIFMLKSTLKMNYSFFFFSSFGRGDSRVVRSLSDHGSSLGSVFVFAFLSCLLSYCFI